MKFTVDKESFTVSIFIEEQEAPLIHQPVQPDNTPWESEAEATAWAEKFVADYEAAQAQEAPAPAELAPPAI